MPEENNQFALNWVADESDNLTSSNISGRARGILEHYEESIETMTRSRVAGVAIQYICPPEHIAQWESQVDAELDESDVPIRASSLWASFENEKILFSESNADLVSKHEFGQVEDKQRVISLPKSVVESIDDAVDDLENYHGKEKARFLANCILAWNASVFQDSAERVQTKQQLLQASRGEVVENPTPTFELIEEGEVFSELQEYAQMRGNNSDVTDIAPDDDVMLEPEDEPVWDELKESPSARLGPFLAVLRRIADDTKDGFRKGVITQYFGGRNDYSAPEKFVSKYVLPEMTEHTVVEGGDEVTKWYVDEDNVPSDGSDADVEEVVDDIKSALSANVQGRSPVSALTQAGVSKSKAKNITAESESSLDRDLLTGEVAAGNIELNQLIRIRDYLVEGLTTKDAVIEHMVEEKAESFDEIYAEDKGWL